MADRKKEILKDVSAVFPGKSCPVAYDCLQGLMTSWRGLCDSWAIWSWQSECLAAIADECRLTCLVDTSADPSRTSSQCWSTRLIPPSRIPSSSQPARQRISSIQYRLR
jgi:hypothetical protein